MNTPINCNQCRVTLTPMECEYRVFSEERGKFSNARICIPGPNCPFVLLAKPVENIPAVLEVKSCEWRENEGGIWETGCERTWEFNDGGPKDNDMTYCHKCGGMIETKPYFRGGE